MLTNLAIAGDLLELVAPNRIRNFENLTIIMGPMTDFASKTLVTD